MKQFKVILNFHMLIFFLVFSSCKEGKSENHEKTSTPESEFFIFRIGNHSIKAEIAILPEEIEKGLMFREKLEPGTGMIFIFKYETPQKFWMKNTRIPLDIGYFSGNGKLLEIHAAKPFDLSGVLSRAKNIKYVLELNLHDFRNQKIKIGDRLNLEDIKNAIKKRGFNPKDFKINQ